MKEALLLVLLLTTAGVAQADGVELKSGRYVGPVIVFKLTKNQKQVIAHFRSCHLEKFRAMNGYTQYVFTLTSKQAEAVRTKKGFSPRHFTVYEAFKRDNDAGPHWNLALRFSPDEFEVPLDLVIPDIEAMKALEVQGWEATNPCFPELRGHVAQQVLQGPTSPPSAGPRP